MKAEKRWLRVRSESGEWKAVQGYIFDGAHLFVIRSLVDKRWWIVSHVGTGFRAAPAAFEKREDAISFMKAMKPFDPAWDTESKQVAHDKGMPLLLAAVEQFGVELVPRVFH